MGSVQILQIPGKALLQHVQVGKGEKGYVFVGPQIL